MRRQSLIWTALPVRREANGILRLSVYVTPKLETDEQTDPTLALFPDFLDWPGRTISFRVAFRNGPTLPATLVARTPAAQPWPYIFKGTTPVDSPEEEPLNERNVRSYPAKHVYEFLKDTYTRVSALSVGRKPTVAELVSQTPLGRVALNAPEGPGEKLAAVTPVLSTRSIHLIDAQRVEQVRQVQRTQLQQRKCIPYVAQADATSDFLQFQDFIQFDTGRIPAFQVNELGFHDLVAALAEYPEIMRDLKLIYDLTVDISGVIVPAESTVKVIPTWRSATTTHTMCPETAYTLNASTFAARSNDPDLVGGMLDLSNSNLVSLVEVDLEAAALHAIHVANRAAATPVGQAGEIELAMPALSTAGLTISQAGLAERVVRQLERTAELNGVLRDMVAGVERAVPVLYLEDLVRGYRVDVWDDHSHTWHSLCGRTGTYTITGVPAPLTYTDEGWVGLGLTQEVALGDLRASESRATWNGWSLAVPRPGKTVGRDGLIESGEGDAPRNYGLTASFAVPPASLPRQRYGVAYRFRARAVDLAGNSPPLTPDSQDFSTATAAKVHWRFEPVLPPFVVPKTALTRGETAERMVVHSQHGQPATEQPERHIAPPRIAQVMAEKHGRFDTAAGGSLHAGWYNYITQHDQPFEFEGTDGTGTVRRYPEVTLPIPYMADLAARGVTFQGLPGTGTTSPPFTQPKFVPPAGPWPRPFRIKVVGGTGYPVWNETEGELKVFLPKAEVATVALTCQPFEPVLDLLGPWQWRIENEAAANLSNLRTLALDGRLWQVTPPRYLELVHAVPKPLEAPTVTNLRSERTLSSTAASLIGALKLDGKSTGKVDLVAEWVDPVDVPSITPYMMVQGQAHVAEITAIDRTAATVNINVRHEFGDTKYHHVKYKPVGTTRFREYFVDDQNPPSPLPDLTSRPDAWYEVDVKSTARPAPPKVAYVIPTFRRTPVTEGAKTGFKREGGLRVYLERPWYSSGADERLGVLVMHDTQTENWEVNNLRPYVTHWGRDPIWKTNGILQAPRLSSFLETSEKPTGLKLVETYPLAAAAAYEVHWDDVRKLWYADIAFYDNDQYSTFIRLALVRYQPHSEDYTVAVSQVVLADFAQLSSDRTATVASVAGQPAKLDLRVTGIATSNDLSGHRGNPLVVSVERLKSGASAQTATEMQWLPEVDSAQLVYPSTDADYGVSVWTSVVTLPEPRGTRPYRVVIREYERIQGDASVTWDADWFVRNGRMVYAETIVV